MERVSGLTRLPVTSGGWSGDKRRRCLLAANSQSRVIHSRREPQIAVQRKISRIDAQFLVIGLPRDQKTGRRRTVEGEDHPPLSRGHCRRFRERAFDLRRRVRQIGPGICEVPARNMISGAAPTSETKSARSIAAMMAIPGFFQMAGIDSWSPAL